MSQFRWPFFLSALVAFNTLSVSPYALAEETVTLSGKTFLENRGKVVIRPVSDHNQTDHAREIRTKLNGHGAFSVRIARSSFPVQIILPIRTKGSCPYRPGHPSLSAVVLNPFEKRPVTIGVLSSLRGIHGTTKVFRFLTSGNSRQAIGQREKVLDQGILTLPPSGISPALTGWAIGQDLSDGVADGRLKGQPIPLCTSNTPAILATVKLTRALLSSTDQRDQRQSRIIALDLIRHLTRMALPLGKERKNGPPLSVPRDSGALVSLSDGKVVSIGGEAATGIVGTVEVFHPETGHWDRSIPDYPLPLAYTAAAPLPDGEIFISGGFNSNGIVKEAYIYAPSTHRWKAIAPDPVSRMGAVTVALPNGNILVVGGQSESGFLSLNEEYSIRTGKWKTLPPAPTARMGGTGLLLADGRILFMGGFESEKGISGSGNLYDPMKQTWSRSIKPGPVPRLYATSLLLPDGNVLVADGFNRSGVLNTLEIYDPAKDQWNNRIKADLTSRKELGASLLPDGTVMLVGGEDAGGNSVGAVTFIK